MKWYERLARWLESRNRYRMIRRDNGEDYLGRYYLLSSKWLGIYLHRFWADDIEGLHDHPWANISILISGAYNEEVPSINGQTTTMHRRPLKPAVIFRKATLSHRITLPEGQQGSWSLFIRFRRVREWGFWSKDFSDWKPARVQRRTDVLC